ncbi:MATE family efflux transporter [Mucilaginibacter sp.]|uniref:MATE family efflux transporter n=1 Tax=Mucilaginibacter sp. TaxID=1882438 RepID=UPI003569B93D
MVESLKSKISLFLNKGHERTLTAKKNVISSLLIKGISIIINLIIVPFTINYVNPEKYGIWLTVSSMILWFNFFDFGLGNGLRNQLSAAIAIKDNITIKKLISTSYASLTIVASIICGVFLFVNHFINYDEILGISSAYRIDVRNLMNILVIFFSVQFVLQLINSINYAFQKTANVSLTFLIGNILSFVFIIIFKYTTTGSLLNLGVAYFSGTLISLLGANFYLFFKNKALMPSLKQVSFQSSKSIMSIGGKFFIIQLAGIIQYQSDNILISRYFSPTNVTQYNIAYKLFSVVMMVFGIIMAPIWSAVTEANIKEDFSWIKSTEKNLLKIWGYFFVFSIALLIISPLIYKVWLHDVVKIPFVTSIGIMLYISSMTYGMIYVHILNGLGKLKTQFYISIITMIVFIPITYLLAVKLQLGIIGISMGLIIANFNGLIAAPFEYKKIIKEKLA